MPMQQARRAIRRRRRAQHLFLDRGRGDEPMRMIVSIVMCAFASICAGSAHAADLPFKAPPPPSPVFSWTGLYVGGNVGGSIGVNSNTQSTTFSSTALGVNGLLT